MLQQDYQDLIQLCRDGMVRHKAHDLKVWGGLLKGSEKGSSSGIDASRESAFMSNASVIAVAL
jgi:hypothetical protein